jgi:hypothetical protein
LARLGIVQLDQAIEGELDLGFVEHVKDNDVVPSMFEHAYRFEGWLYVRQQIAHQHD